MIVYKVELWCDGECSTRYLGTSKGEVPAALPQLAFNLIQRAKAEGWTQDGNSLWCPSCVRLLHPGPAPSASQYRRDGRVGGGK